MSKEGKNFIIRYSLFDIRYSIFTRLVVMLLGLLLLFLSAGTNPALAAPAKRVLLLHSYHQGLVWTDQITEGIRSVFDRAEFDVELNIEYMDTRRHRPEEVYTELERLYKVKFVPPFDAVIACDDQALNFLLTRRDNLLPGVPLIFCGIDNRHEPSGQKHKDITGVFEDIDLAGTIELILRLHPQTRNIAVITDSTEAGEADRKELERIKPSFVNSARFIDLAGDEAQDLAAALKNLPANTVVLLLAWQKDRAGRSFSEKEAAELVAASTSQPVYTCRDYYIRNGVIGGVVTSGRLQGEAAARLALRVLSGEPAASIPVMRQSPNVPMFDYLPLRDRGLAVSMLPAASVLFNEPRSFYYHNARVIWGIIAVLFCLLGMIAALWAIIVKRRQAQINDSILLRQLKSVFHHLPVGIAYLDAECRFIGANRFFSTFSGFREVELIGRKCYETIGEYAGDPRRAGLEKVCGFCKKEDCFRQKRPAVFHRMLGDSFFKVTLIPELDKDGKVYRLMEVFEDITERRLAEKALSESEKNFRELVESSLAGILIIQNGRIIYKNPEQERLLGEVPESFSLTDYEGIHTDDVEKVRHMFDQITGGESQVLDMDFRFYPVGRINSKPDMKWVYCRARLIEYQGKEATLVSMMDMSRAKELEHLLRMEDKMASLGHVAAGIAHEIRNPLSGINIYLSALKKICRREAGLEKACEIIGQLQSASSKIESVIRRVMDFSRPSEPRFQLVNINMPVQTALDLSAVTLRKTGITMKSELTTNLPSCHADPNLMEQVVLNLINNASEAMRNMESGKIIEVSTSLDDKRKRVLVKVADSGPGVPENLKDRIFEPFYTTKYDGTGIGLSLCHRIMSDHSGSLEVQKSRYNGAEFIIAIPVERRRKPR